MFVTHIKDVTRTPFIASKDGCRIKEVIHPTLDDTSPGVSLAWAEVDPGQATYPHHLDFLEIYYLLEGRGRMFIDGESADVEPGQAVYIPAGRIQYILNTGDDPLRFLCLCHPAYEPQGDHPAPSLQKKG